jgi:hypothetical protein
MKWPFSEVSRIPTSKDSLWIGSAAPIEILSARNPQFLPGTGGLHTWHGVYPSSMASLRLTARLLCLRYWQPARWYRLPVLVT